MAACPLPSRHELPRWGDRRRTRVGVLGGSFNPAHAGHLHVARTALRRLRLDQVWLLVSPGNPLKPRAGMAPFPDRLLSARRIADGRRVVATGIEACLGLRYTWQVLAALQRRFPQVEFAWLMGADNLEQLPRWRRWMRVARAMPFAVLPRPSYNHRALAGKAAQRLRHGLRHPSAAPALPSLHPPAWSFLTVRQNPISATALRAAQAALHSAPPPTPRLGPVAGPSLGRQPGASP